MRSGSLKGGSLGAVDWSNKDLHGAQLQEADLKGANLSFCDLRDADLSGDLSAPEAHYGRPETHSSFSFLAPYT